MKLCVAIVHNRDKSRIMDEMTRAGFKFTVIGSTGGFLREGNTTFLIGLDDQEVPLLQKVFSETCPAREQLVNVAPIEAGPQGTFIPSPIKVPVGGGGLFILGVDEFFRV
jgi:uncharacterized protein YaaQ